MLGLVEVEGVGMLEGVGVDIVVGRGVTHHIEKVEAGVVHTMSMELPMQQLFILPGIPSCLGVLLPGTLLDTPQVMVL
jgi:hypothetical protein